MRPLKISAAHTDSLNSGATSKQHACFAEGYSNKRDGRTQETECNRVADKADEYSHHRWRRRQDSASPTRERNDTQKKEETQKKATRNRTYKSRTTKGQEITGYHTTRVRRDNLQPSTGACSVNHKKPTALDMAPWAQ